MVKGKGGRNTSSENRYPDRMYTGKQLKSKNENQLFIFFKPNRGKCDSIDSHNNLCDNHLPSLKSVDYLIRFRQCSVQYV
jgi:hypothetical protein